MSYGMMAVNAVAALLIVFVIWWFFGGKMQAVSSAEGPISIVVKDGVYQPAVIQVHANQPLTFHFLREDESPCSGTVVFQQLNIAYELPRNKITEIILPPQSSGVIDFTCPMKMYRGKIVVS
jgi:plastocyanin domain-containing protein